MTTRDIWDGVVTVVCDLDGVVYLGEHGIPGAGEALSALAASGLQTLFVTNNSTKSAQTAAAKIAATTGFAPSPEDVITSAEVTAGRLAGVAEMAFVIGAEAIADALLAVGVGVTPSWQEADAVVVGLDRTITYDKLSAATLAIRRGAAFYATNLDATFPTPQGLLPGGGAIVAAIATATDREPVVSGKPEAAMIEHISHRARGPILVVGDRPNTDIAMAVSAGWASALVLTGVVSSLTEVPARYSPDIVVGSLRELVERRGA